MQYILGMKGSRYIMYEGKQCDENNINVTVTMKKTTPIIFLFLDFILKQYLYSKKYVIKYINIFIVGNIWKLSK